MKLEDWVSLRVGAVVADHMFRGVLREVFSVKRISGTRGQAGKTRVCLTVTNLKSKASPTHIFISDQLGPKRFDLVSVPWRCPTRGHKEVVYATYRPRCLTEVADYVCGLEMVRA